MVKRNWNWQPSTDEEKRSFIKKKSEFSAAVLSKLSPEWQTAKEISDALKESIEKDHLEFGVKMSKKKKKFGLGFYFFF